MDISNAAFQECLCQKILLFLDLPDVVKLERVCTLFRKIVQDSESFWTAFVQSQWGFQQKDLQARAYVQRRWAAEGDLIKGKVARAEVSEDAWREIVAYKVVEATNDIKKMINLTQVGSQCIFTEEPYLGLEEIFFLTPLVQSTLDLTKLSSNLLNFCSTKLEPSLPNLSSAIFSDQEHYYCAKSYSSHGAIEEVPKPDEGAIQDLSFANSISSIQWKVEEWQKGVKLLQVIKLPKEKDWTIVSLGERPGQWNLSIFKYPSQKLNTYYYSFPLETSASERAKNLSLCILQGKLHALVTVAKNGVRDKQDQYGLYDCETGKLRWAYETGKLTYDHHGIASTTGKVGTFVIFVLQLQVPAIAIRSYFGLRPCYELWRSESDAKQVSFNGGWTEITF